MLLDNIAKKETQGNPEDSLKMEKNSREDVF